MVGIQCKSCKHRALWSGPPRPDNEVMELLRRSPQACPSCGETEFNLISITGGLHDQWLSDGPPSPASGPLIEK
jgi:predicted nucleic-acid-binding Zn-ribbon protein